MEHRILNQALSHLISHLIYSINLFDFYGTNRNPYVFAAETDISHKFLVKKSQQIKPMSLTCNLLRGVIVCLHLFFNISNLNTGVSANHAAGVSESPLAASRNVLDYYWDFSDELWAAPWQNQQNDCALRKDSDQPGHSPSLIRFFAVRMNKPWIHGYPLSAQRRLWSDWADAQADLSLRWAHSHFAGFVMSRLISVSNSLGLGFHHWLMFV